MRMRALMLALFIIPPLTSSALAGQVAGTGSLTVASAWFWRGLSLVNRPVVQPEVSASAGPLTLDLWGNIEPFRYRGDDVLSALGGRRAPGFTEIDPSVEVAGSMRGADVALGVLAYLFTHQAGFETAPNTAEIYARAALTGKVPLSLAANYDVHCVKGVYLEAGLEHAAPRLTALQLALRVGASVGEASGPEGSYYEKDGITHVETAASWPLRVGRAEFTPSASLVAGVDRAARWVSAERTRRVKGVVGASITWPAGDD